MPYIDKYTKEVLDQDIRPLLKLLCNADTGSVEYGRIEYVIFRILCEAADVNKRFTNLNSLVGILSTTEHEFVDKIVKPYENSKLLSEWSGKTLTSKLVKVTKKKRSRKKKSNGKATEE